MRKWFLKPCKEKIRDLSSSLSHVCSWPLAAVVKLLPVPKKNILRRWWRKNEVLSKKGSKNFKQRRYFKLFFTLIINNLLLTITRSLSCVSAATIKRLVVSTSFQSRTSDSRQHSRLSDSDGSSGMELHSVAIRADSPRSNDAGPSEVPQRRISAAIPVVSTATAPEKKLQLAWCG